MKSNEIEYATKESLISNVLVRVSAGPKDPRKGLIEPSEQVTVLTVLYAVHVF